MYVCVFTLNLQNTSSEQVLLLFYRRANKYWKGYFNLAKVTELRISTF